MLFKVHASCLCHVSTGHQNLVKSYIMKTSEGAQDADLPEEGRNISPYVRFSLLWKCLRELYGSPCTRVTMPTCLNSANQLKPKILSIHTIEGMTCSSAASDNHWCEPSSTQPNISDNEADLSFIKLIPCNVEAGEMNSYNSIVHHPFVGLKHYSTPCGEMGEYPEAVSP